jgi:prophage maintenance system killer protein
LTRPTALGFALVVNDPFLDGNKRVGHVNVTTTARYLNVKDDYPQELTERKPLAAC